MKKIFFVIILILALISFYKINELNYKKIREIKKDIVNHPEGLPTKEVAKNSTLGFANARADLYWLQAIQYIGGNAISSEYKKYLFTMLDIITELNPSFEHPYIIGELLLPTYNQRYEDLTQEQQDINTNQAVLIGEKGIKNFCDPKKLKLIKKEFNLNKLWSEEKYKNPCKSYSVPYNLAFVYYYYLHDPITSAYYYKVASTIDDTLESSKVMSAIMQGKGGDREKAFFMFLNLASQAEKQDEVCSQFATQLNSLALEGSLKNDSFTVKQIEEARIKLFPKIDEGEESNGLKDAQCGNFLNKAIRELNLSYIEDANKKHIEKEGKPAINAQKLLEKGYIDFLPTDPQQEEDYGVIYSYNEDTKNFDYEMGYYEK